MTDDTGGRCKGCWGVGNNCGGCGHCLATAREGVEAIRDLRGQRGVLRQRLERVRSALKLIPDAPAAIRAALAILEGETE